MAGDDTAIHESTISDLEVVKQGYAAWSRGDLDAFVAHYTESVEVRPYLGRSLGASTYHGHAGLRQWYSDATEEWDRLDVTPEEFIEGDGVVVVGLRAVGLGKGSHIEVDAHIWHVIELAEGKVYRLRGFGDRAEALRAAGMKERNER
jgi:ketosteroid isomerase-like protein